MNSGVTDHQQLQKWSGELQRVNDDIESKTLRWLELAEIVE
jgi:ABC transport system ATP-binding/permease protein